MGMVDRAGPDDGTATKQWRPGRLPIVGLTGNALAEDVDLFLASGADRVLTKPVHVETIMVVLQELTQLGMSSH